MNIFLRFLGYTGFAIAALIVYYLLNAYVLKKIKINKWIVLAGAVAFWILPGFIRVSLPYNLGTLIPAAFVVIFFLWFLDLSGYTGARRRVASSKAGSTVGRYKNEKNIVIKPKAKPNRVKNNKQQ